jgi:hypothetical protein
MDKSIRPNRIAQPRARGVEVRVDLSVRPRELWHRGFFDGALSFDEGSTA